MTTSQTTLAGRIHAEAAKRGVASFDAPASGGDVGAKQAKVAIMVEGDRMTFDRVLPFFKRLGKTIALMGGPGVGQHAKMVNQILIAGTMIGMVERLLHTLRAGLDPSAAIDSVGKGAAGS
jgi:3-hydroxyisobutyrate dehydrogenase